MGDMLADHITCNDRDNVCPACSLFGMTGKTSNGSRLRFTDAIMDKPMPRSEKVLLKELSGPKTSYLPFFLRSMDGKPDKDISYDNDAYTIRGRKFYWHNMKKDSYIDTTGKEGERNASVELVKEGSRFRFSVYYDNLSDDEVNKLIWTLTLGENVEDGKQCHKIGHGKPIGLGSVKIVVKSINDRKYENGSYSVSHIENPTTEEGLFTDEKAISQIKMITRLDACTYPVDYPGIVDERGKRYIYGGNNRASHQWFTTNFSLGKSPEKMLPEIDDINEARTALVWKTDVIQGQSKVSDKGGSYDGEVTGYNSKKTTAFIKLRKSNKKAAIYFKSVPNAEYGKIDEALGKGKEVKVRYVGKDSDGRDQWELVK